MFIFNEQQQRGRVGELQMMLRLLNENYNHPTPGDSKHEITDVSKLRKYQSLGVDLVETWRDIWGEPHELWHEVKTEYTATTDAAKHPGEAWAEIASYYFGKPWSIGTGNLFIETRQKKEPGWYDVMRSVDPKDHYADNRIIWFVLPSVQQPAPQPWKADQYNVPTLLIAVPYRGLIGTVENWKDVKGHRLIQTPTSEGYAMPITELWNWTSETRRRAEAMKPVKLEGLQSGTGSGARLYVYHDMGGLTEKNPKEREATVERWQEVIQDKGKCHAKPDT